MSLYNQFPSIISNNIMKISFPTTMPSPPTTSTAPSLPPVAVTHDSFEPSVICEDEIPADWIARQSNLEDPLIGMVIDISRNPYKRKRSEMDDQEESSEQNDDNLFVAVEQPLKKRKINAIRLRKRKQNNTIITTARPSKKRKNNNDNIYKTFVPSSRKNIGTPSVMKTTILIPEIIRFIFI